MNFFQNIFILTLFLSYLHANHYEEMNGYLNQSLSINVSQSHGIFIFYEYNQSPDDNTYLRASVVAHIGYHHSVLVTLKDNNEQISHFKLSNNKNISKQTANRTICPVLKQYSKANLSTTRSLTVDVSSESTIPINVIILIEKKSDFVIKVGSTRSFLIDDMSPVFFMFKFDDHIGQANVIVTSPDKTCMTLSIQDAICPAKDLVQNVKFQSTYQTVTSLGSIVIPEKNSVFIVLVLNFNDVDCNGRVIPLTKNYNKTPRIKNVTLKIEKVMKKRDYVLPVFGVVAFYLAFFIIALVISFIYNTCFHKNIVPDVLEIPIVDTALVDPLRYGSTEEIADMNTLYSRNNKPFYKTFNHDAEASSTTSRRLDSEDGTFDSVSDASTDPNIYRLNMSLFVSDLSKKPSAVLNRKYFLYLWYLIIISVFYALPVVQLVITYQKAFQLTGNEDMCFYNFMCTRPLFIFTAFNNIISNIGYVLLGILFTLITWRRHRLYNECHIRRIMGDSYRGIPQYNGLFYAMGMALTMEGILSACYHICPSNNNFQFDTAYMYILACLCMIKIYQTRHPDVNASAHSFFMTMSFIIFVGVIGVVYNSLLFWIFFTILYLSISCLLTTEVYYIGRWTLDTGLPRRVYQTIINDRWLAFMPTYKKRMLVLVLFNIINLVFAFYGGIQKPKDFASFFLGIFMLNLLMYFGFYIAMKMRHCEHFHVLPIIYVIIAIICWSFAIFCFIKHPTDWTVTPAKSRQDNKNCSFLDFYDIHDIWHFLSSMSMFFSFLALQNLDDSLFNVDRDQIPVF